MRCIRRDLSKTETSSPAAASARTCPFLSSALLVSLSFSNETVCRSSWSPLNGESGCRWRRPGGAGSALPATSHDDLPQRAHNINSVTNNQRILTKGCIAGLQPPPPNCPFPWGIRPTPNILGIWFLGPTRVYTQTASPSVQPLH